MAVTVEDGAEDGEACSNFARRRSVDPIGSASSYDEIVLVERDLPWPRDAADDPAAVEAAGTASRVRVQLVAAPTRAGRTEAPAGIIRYRRRPAPMFRRFDRLVDHCTDADGGAGVATRDVLVCTHGTRDRCCGSAGTRLVADVSGSTPGVTLWRTSHLGGHRFAPTALLLPEGTAWGYLDPDVLLAIINREGRLDELSHHYRGCIGLDAAEVQTVDREGLLRHGWSWLDAHRSGIVRSRARDRADVGLEYELPDGTSGSFEATVVTRRRLPVPDCRADPASAQKISHEFAVTDLRHRQDFRG